MNFTIIFLYQTGKKEVEHKTFEAWESCDYWAEKECIYRKAKSYHIK